MRALWPRRLGTRIALTYALVLICVMLLFTAGTAAILFLQMRVQLKHFAIQDIETVEGLLALTPDEDLIVRDDYHNHAESKLIVEHFLEIQDLNGNILFRNARLGNRRLGGRPLPNEGVGGYSPRSAELADGTRVMMVSRQHSMGGKVVLIRLAHSEEPLWLALEQFVGAGALMFIIMIGAAAIVGYRMSRRVLAPVQEITSRAEQITSSRLHERLPVNGTGDELDHLAEVFNQTLSRLDQSFRQLRQFTSDASHELRTPLAAIRAIGEVGLSRDGTKQDYRELLGSMLEEVNRLTRLIDELLMISRGDAGAIHLNYRPVAIYELARETMALLEPLAEEKSQKLVLAGEADTTVQADPVFLRQALMNVLHNAIKYSPDGSTTRLRVGREESGAVTIAVEDSGPGIAPEHVERIFDRFYRVDQGRSRETGGFGLGLAIAQWAVQAHKGMISVAANNGQGSTFRITLPVDGGI